MNSRKEKIIVTAAIIAISLTAIFFLSEIAAAPSTPSFPANIIANIFSADPEQGTNNANTKQKLPEIESKPVVLIFGGDVMLSRRVNDQMASNYDYAWPFINIASFLSAADLTVINLESPFLAAKNYVVPTGSFSFKANPEAVSGLVKSGVDLAALANNHMLNQGAIGIEKTKEVLSAAGIRSIGAGQNETEARAPETFTIDNRTFGFLNYAYPDDNSIATAKNPGIAGMDLEKMAVDVSELKTKTDVVIVIMHAGEEYTTTPNSQQIAFAHQAIEAGADLVIGHHPHWPQIWEEYQGKPIIYSLGNLVFDQMWSEETKVGLLAKLEWREGWQKIEFIPVSIHDYGQAEIITDEAKKAALFKKLNIPADGNLDLNQEND